MPDVPTPVRVAVLNEYPIVVTGLSVVMARHPARIHVTEIGWESPIPEDVEIVLCDTFASDTADGHGLLDLVARTDAKVVLFAGDLSDHAITAALQAGVADYISKRVTIEELLTTLEAIRDGEPVVRPTFDRTEAPGVGTWPGRTARLSAREAEVLAYIARGHTNEQIAASLYLSINSVKTYIRSGYRKIGVQRRTQAVLWALDNGFVQAPVGPVGRKPITAVRAAVAAALKVVAAAAEGTRHQHHAADRRAADLVADQAVQDAVATQYRAEAEAIRVRRAADAAAVTARQHEEDPESPEALTRAAGIEAAVQAAAAALQKRTAALALSVATLVEARADDVSTTRARFHRHLAAATATTASEAQAGALAAPDPGATPNP